MDKNGREIKTEGEPKAHDHAPPLADATKHPKKRRKVNHGTLRPLTSQLRQADMRKRHRANFCLARSYSLCILPTLCKSRSSPCLRPSYRPCLDSAYVEVFISLAAVEATP